MTTRDVDTRARRGEPLETCPCCGHELAGEVRGPGRARAATGAQFAALLGSAAAIAIAGVLLATDVLQVGTGRDAHALISALPLACIAVAFLLHQPVRRPTRGQAVKAGLLSAAFLLWAAYQLQPSLPVFVNDLAITLFVLDVGLVIRDDLRPS
jgi:predicted lipid-binding transport protein (Tim44 family)